MAVIIGRQNRADRLPERVSARINRCYYAFSAEGRKLLAQGMAAFGGIAPTYRIALLDKPTIVWDFHSLLLVLQMMFSFMVTEDTTQLRISIHSRLKDY